MTRRLLALASVLSTLVGCSWGTITPEDFKKEFGISSSTSIKEVNVMSVSGMKLCLTKLQTAVGEKDVHATALDLHATFMTLTARRPTQRDSVDTFECRHGEVGPSKPSRPASASVLDNDTFTFSEIDLDGLPARLDSAVSDLDVGGAVSFVTIRKAGPPNARYVSVKVAVVGSRKDASVEYDGKGNKVASATPTSVNRATIATAKLPSDRYVAFDAPEIASLTTFDPDALTAGSAIGIARAWKSDAVMVQLGVMHPTIDRGGRLASDSCSYRFNSPACFTANEPACELDLLVGGENARYVPSRVSVSVTHGNAATPTTNNPCTLRAALSTLAALDPPFGGVDSATFDDTRKAIWTFTRAATTTPHDPGRHAQVDASTCAVMH